ncbi:MAG: hypothetical protein IH983_04460 [Planctomycetes bacterium]|nr:hypothetical protein [Planctomycetota bacterium]
MTPRRKRWYRPRNLAIGLGGAAALFIAYQVYWAATAEPAPVINYAAKLVELCESAQPAGENCWPLFIEAATILDEVEAEIRERGFEPRFAGSGFFVDYSLVYDPPAAGTDVEPERLALAMLRERGAFDLLAEAAVRPRAVRPIIGPSPLFHSVSLPELAQFQRLARARVASMRLAFDEGDMAEAVATFEQTMALGRACGAQPFLIDQLIGRAIAALATSYLRYELMERSLDTQTCLELLSVLDRQRPLSRPGVALEGERLLMFDFIQWAYTDDGHGDGRLNLQKYSSFGTGAGSPSQLGVLGTFQSIFLAGRAETIRLVDEFYDGMVSEAKMNPIERAKSPFDADAFEAKLTARHIFLNAMLPAAGKFIEKAEVIDVGIEGLRVMLALEAYRSKHGAYPASLRDLVPKILGELPTDPIHGGAFGYHLVTDDPHGRAYLLYSTGLDRTDNDGVELDGSGITKYGWAGTLVNPETSGFDFVINQPRRQE